MAQTRAAFVENIRVAMVDNSPYQDITGGPMPTFMENTMTDSMERLANPIWDMVASWALGLEGDEFPDERVRMSIDDPLTGYLGDKIDNDTLKFNPTTFELYVNSLPLASNTQIGGALIGLSTDSALYMQGSELLLRTQTSGLLSTLDNEVPTSNAVKIYVDNAIQSAAPGGTSGDMLKSTYDNNSNGIVDDSELLNGQASAYYLAWANFTGIPTTVAGYGITDAMTTAHDANIITSTNITNWNTAYGWGDHASQGYGDVTKVGTPANNQVGVWTGDGTLEGESSLLMNSVTASLTPSSANGLNLGSSTLYWQYAHATRYNIQDGTQYIAKDGSNNLTFTDAITGTKTLAELAGTGNVTKVGTPVDKQIAVWTGDGTLEGNSGLTYDATALICGSNIIQTTGTYKSLGTQDIPWYALYATAVSGRRGTISNVTGYELNISGGQAYSTGDNKGGTLSMHGGPGSGSGAWGDFVIRYIPNDETETNILAYDTSQGIISYKSVTSLISPPTIVNVGGATYSITSTVDIVGAPNTTTTALEITLTTAETTSGRLLLIKDTGGSASTNNITIVTEGSQTIDGEASLVLNTDYAAINLYSDGNNWFTYPVIASGGTSISAYSALTTNSNATWDTSGGLNKTWSIDGSYTLTLSNLANGMSGDLKLTVSTGPATVTLAGTGITFLGNGSIASLATGVYHIVWVCTSSSTVEYSIASYA